MSRSSATTRRGQANLVALVAALIALVAVTTLGLSLANAAFTSADRPVEDRRVALALSERLVTAESPLTVRANVLDSAALAGLDAGQLATSFPVVGNRPVRVRLNDRTVLQRGPSTGGATVRRVVLVSKRTNQTVQPAFESQGEPTVSLPRRTNELTITIDPPPGTTVRTVRVNERVILHEPAGLDGTYSVRVSRFETTRIAFDVSGPLPQGSVEITYYPAETEKAVLEVTVGAD